MIRKFSVNEMDEMMVGGQPCHGVHVKTIITDIQRWEIYQDVIFERDGSLWKAVYIRPKNERGDCRWDNEFDGQVSCTPVVAVQKMVTTYEAVS